MSKYSYVVSKEDLERSFMPNPLLNFEGYFAAWQSKADVLQNMLPPPLKLESDVVKLYTCNIQNPAKFAWYREANMMLTCSMNGTPGVYTVSMLLEGPGAEMGTYLGREGSKMAKKLCNSYTINKVGPMGTSVVNRGGVDLMDLKIDINGSYNDPAGEEFFKGYEAGNTVNNDSFLVQYDKGVKDGKPAYINGRMVMGKCHIEMKKWEKGTIDLKLGETVNDPWAEAEVVKPLGGGYCLFDLFITGMEDFGEIDAVEALRRTYKHRYDVGTFGMYTQSL